MSTAIAKPEKPFSQTIQELIVASGPRFAGAISKRVTADRLASIVCLSVATNEKLAACSSASLVQSALRSAQLGLSLDPVLGEAYLVPYKGVATFQPGYRGLLKLAYRGGLRKAYAYVVRQGEPFKVTLGLAPNIAHEPGYDMGASVTHAYAVVYLPGGDVDFEVMSWDEIEAIRQASPSGNSPAWMAPHTRPEMEKKTVLKRLLKRQNLQWESPEIEALVKGDDDDATMPRVFAAPMPQLAAAPTTEPETEPATSETVAPVAPAAPAASAPPPPPPPPAPPAPRPKPKAPAPDAPLLSGSAILGPLTEGLDVAMVLDFVRDWSPPGAPATATSLDQVMQEHLLIVQRDPAGWRTKLNAWLT
jgi:recombination protein RecT